MKARWIGTTLGATLVGALALVGTARLEAGEPTPDTRQRIVLPAVGRDKILSEMRVMLQSLGGVLHGLAANDLPAAEKAARVSGIQTAADVDPEIKQRLPRPFLQLGMQTHQAFDRVADQIKAGGSRDQALGALAALTANCLACHAAYRLEERR